MKRIGIIFIIIGIFVIIWSFNIEGGSLTLIPGLILFIFGLTSTI